MESHLQISESESADPLRCWLESVRPQLENLVGEFYQQYWPESLWKPKSCEVSLTFLDSQEMSQLNDQYRQQAQPTDVLSFPLWELEGAFVPSMDCGDEFFPMGDLFFCSSVLRQNAAQHGVSEKSELLLLLFHGLLHLMAWDHATEEDERTMWLAQEQGRNKALEMLGEHL